MNILNSRTAIRLPHKLYLKVKGDAKSRNMPYSELIRQILEAHYAKESTTSENVK